jgi:hypothetical protein
VRIPSDRLPGAGFVLLIASWGGLAAFVAWGFREPDLDRAWRALQAADRGAAEVDAEDAEALDRSFARHPEIAFDRLGDSAVKFLGRTQGGWSRAPAAHVIVAPVPAQGLEIAVEARCLAGGPATVRLAWTTGGCVVTVAEDGRATCRLTAADAPAGGGRPFLARLSTDGAFGCAGRPDATAGLRLSAEPAGGAR